MKRGLIEWDPRELPRETLAARVAHAQALLAADGLDAALVYTNVAAPQLARYLTHFLPYWNEGVLVLPREGAPTLLVALSNRVVPWIKGSSALEDVRACRQPAAEAARLLAERGARRIGLAERGSFPYRLLAELERAAPDIAFADWPALAASLTLATDPAERRLRARARELAEHGLRSLGDMVDGRSAQQLAGQLDLALRLAGATDTRVLVGPLGRWPGVPTALPGDAAAVGDAERSGAVPLARAANVLCEVEYKGHWALVARTLGLPAADQRAGSERLHHLCTPGSTIAEAAAAARAAHGGALFAYRAGTAAPFVALDETDRLGVGDIVALVTLSPADGGALYGDTFVVAPDGLKPLAS